MYDSVRAFIEALERAGELARVRAPVSPLLEITEIADRESKSPAAHLPSASARRNDPRFHDRGGRALLFERVEGSEMPLLINAWGSYRRMEMAISCNEAGPGVAHGKLPGGFDAVADRIGSLVKPEPPRGLGEIVAKARQFAPLLRIPPRTVRSGPVQEALLTGDRIDLTRFPFLKCWPLDGDPGAVSYPADVNRGVPAADLANHPDYRGRYITFAGVHSIHADDAGMAKPSSHNIGMYRMQLIGRQRLAMHWHMHHDGARHWRSWKRRGERMPVAIVLGGESVLPFASIAPLPPGMSELLFAGFLNGRGIPLVKGQTVPVRYPANAEIVLEGYVSSEAGGPGYDPRVDPESLGPGAFFEGPFGDHTGFYSLPDRYPIVEITAIVMRRNPVFPATIVGLPPQEDYYMGKATERIFLPLLKTIIHDIEDYDLPLFGAFHNCAVVQIKKEYPLQARRVMHAIWGAGQMAWTKTIIVVDEDVDVHDACAVASAVGERCNPARDIEIVNGPLDILDHAAPRLGAGCKIGLDATHKIQGEEVHGVPIEGKPPSGGIGSETIESLRLIEGVDDVALPNQESGEPGGWRGWLFVRTNEADAGRRTMKEVFDLLDEREDAAAIRCVIVVGPDVDLRDPDMTLFHWCANSDPGRDAVRWGERIGFDATPKRPEDGTPQAPIRDWPPIIEMDEATKRRVTERWNEYELGKAHVDSVRQTHAAAPASSEAEDSERWKALFVEGRAESPRFGC